MQFAKDASSLYAEVGSNRSLPDDRQLSPEDEQCLATSGWQQPPDREHVNWWLNRRLPLTPDEYAHEARLAVTALRDAPPSVEPSMLEYRAWNDRTRGALALPALPPAEPLVYGEASITEPES